MQQISAQLGTPVSIRISISKRILAKNKLKKNIYLIIYQYFKLYLKKKLTIIKNFIKKFFFFIVIKSHGRTSRPDGNPKIEPI